MGSLETLGRSGDRIRASLDKKGTLRTLKDHLGIFAPQAPFEESATTEASRRCPLTGFLREFRVMFWGHVLEVFANGICVLAVQNTTPEMLRIGQNLSDVCLSVCLSVTLFLQPLFR